MHENAPLQGALEQAHNLRSAARFPRQGYGSIHDPHGLGCGPYCCISFFCVFQDMAQERMACFLRQLLSEACVHLQATSVGLHNAHLALFLTQSSASSPSQSGALEMQSACEAYKRFMPQTSCCCLRQGRWEPCLGCALRAVRCCCCPECPLAQLQG